MTTEKTDILSLTLPQLSEEIKILGEKSFRAGQVYGWLHEKRANSFDEMSNLSKKLRESLGERFYICSPKIVRKLVSAIDGTVKYLFEFPDGERAETVLMSYKHGNSICLSTQVGCRMGCSFCASTKAGFVRHLMPGEIVSQIYAAEADSGRKVGSIVLMGIGAVNEPPPLTISFNESGRSFILTATSFWLIIFAALSRRRE